MSSSATQLDCYVCSYPSMSSWSWSMPKATSWSVSWFPWRLCQRLNNQIPFCVSSRGNNFSQGSLIHIPWSDNILCARRINCVHHRFIHLQHPTFTSSFLHHSYYIHHINGHMLFRNERLFIWSDLDTSPLVFSYSNGLSSSGVEEGGPWSTMCSQKRFEIAQF